MTSGATLWDGFFGALAGGGIAALIALWTTRSAIRTEKEARDRDRTLQAALRFREFVSELGAASFSAYKLKAPQFDPATVNQLRSSSYLALKSAQFALHGDADFKGWLTWLNDQLGDQITDGAVDKDQMAWVGDQANLLEGRLLEGGDLRYEKRPRRA